VAIPLETGTPIAMNGMFSGYFESLWYELSLLTASPLPHANVSIPIFKDGLATEYLEYIWNLAAADLGKDNINTGVILVDSEGRATLEFEDYWEDLTT